MKKKLFSAFLIIVTAAIPTFLSAATFGSNSADIKNSYLIPELGSSVVLSSYGLPNIQATYLHVVGIDEVDGVKCVRVISIGTEASEFDESWLAKDVNGDVYILKNLDFGESPIPVVYGAIGAEFLMSSNPEVGDVLFGGDETVTHVGVTVPQLSTGLGPFTNCLQTVELNGDINYYARDYGMVKVEDQGGSTGWELKYIITSTPKVVVIPLF